MTPTTFELTDKPTLLTSLAAGGSVRAKNTGTTPVLVGISLTGTPTVGSQLEPGEFWYDACSVPTDIWGWVHSGTGEVELNPEDEPVDAKVVTPDAAHGIVAEVEKLEAEAEVDAEKVVTEVDKVAGEVEAEGEKVLHDLEGNPVTAADDPHNGAE